MSRRTALGWMLLALGWLASESRDGFRAQEPGVSKAIAVGKATQLSLSRVIEQSGRIEAFAQTPLHSKVSGFVSAVHKDIGDRVRAGDLLAEIDVPELVQELAQKQAKVDQCKAEIELARKILEAAAAQCRTAESQVVEAKAGRARAQANYDRWQSENRRVTALVERRVLDEQTRDETLNQFRAAASARDEIEARVRSAEAAHGESEAKRGRAAAEIAVAEAATRVAQADADRLKALVAFTQVRAPFAGVVTARHIDIGHLLQPAAREKPLFVITQYDPVRVFVDVPEQDAPWVESQSQAEVRVPALHGQVAAGVVSRSSWVLDARTHTLHTAIDLPNPEGRLRPGMYVTAKIQVKLPESWTLPVAAVVKQGETAFAFLVRDGKAQRVLVQLGKSDGTRVEIDKREDLANPGKWLAVTGQETFVLKTAGVVDGQPIDPAP